MNLGEWLKPIGAAIAGAAVAALLNYNTISHRVDQLEQEKKQIEKLLSELQIKSNTLGNRVSSNRTFARHNCRRLDVLEEVTELPVQDDCGRPY